MSQTIVVIEDSHLVQSLYRQKFTAERFRVLIAGDGLEGLRLLAKETPDIILLDLDLPGVNGYQILEMVKRERRLRDVPVIVFSGRSASADHQKALDLGASDYIIKSTTPPNVVIQRVREALLRHQAEKGQMRLAVDLGLLDGPRLAAAAGLPKAACTACGAGIAAVLTAAGDGWSLAHLACTGCGKTYASQVQQPVAPSATR